MNDFIRQEEIQAHQLMMVYNILYGSYKDWVEENWEYIKWGIEELEMSFDEIMERYLHPQYSLEHLKDMYNREKAVKASI